MPPQISSRAWIYVGLGAAALTAVGLVELLSGPTLRPGDRILLVGDSLAVGLSTPLGALAKDRGIAFSALATVGTRIDQWAQSQDLKDALASFQPTIVLISLGTNDAYMMPPPDVGVRQAPYMEALLTMIETGWTHSDDYGLGPRAIVWIAPPTLPDAAISLAPVRALIADQAAILHRRISIYPSDRLTLARGPDGIHPVVSAYAAWAGAIWQWLT
jgi:lysophospholipase L1-like esterase